jgi:rod shape determining protein RodA
MAVTTVPVSTAPSFGRSNWRDLDWLMLALVLVLSVWSCFTILSATRPAEETFGARTAATASPAAAANSSAAVSTLESLRSTRTARSSDVTKQAIWIALGLCAIALLITVDFQFLMHMQFWIYVASFASLLLVLAIGKEVNGAKSWITLGPFLLQPSEFTKVATIVTLAAFLCRRQERIRDASTLLWSLAYLGPLLFLILKQPDFGTMLSVLSIWFGMLFFGGARLWHLGLTLLIGVLMFGAAWRMNVLKPHQKERLAVFLQTDGTSRANKREGYHIKQSQIAIGAGQITGQGWGQGMQNRAGYVPEKTTDFIFAVVAEELGFVGAGVLLVLYLIFLSRSAMLAMTSDNYFGVLIAGGFTALIGFHTIVNLGMTMRVMPITGVPLPFFSYGGSSYLAFSMCVGLLQSIALRRRRLSSF